MEENESLHTEALERFAISEQSDKSQRELAVEDMRFAHAEDGQWDESAILKRKDRPRYTINKVAGALDQLVGDQRQNRTDIKIIPKTGANKDTAKTLNGLVRAIQQDSKATNAYDIAYDELIAGGYGGWRVITEYSEDDIFKQDIKIKPITSAATSLWFDPSAQEYDKRDSDWAFLSYDMPREEFKEDFPNAQVTEFDQLKYANDLHTGWYRDDVIRVAEYWVKTPIIKNMAQLSDGRVIDLDEDGAVVDELALKGIKVIKTRKVDTHKVEMYLMSGGEILKGPMAWAGKYIPLIPAYGKTIKIEGKTYVRGLVRFAKDPSRIYNYATSAAIEASALTPKDPIWITASQASGHEQKLREFNTKNTPFMFYNPDPLAPGVPQRTGAPSVQTAILQQIQQAGMDIHATTGLEPASLGNVPELKSGKAIEAQQKMGDRGSFIFIDNLHKSIQYTGEILIDLIPKIYDTQRMVHILNIDGTTEETPINAKQLNAIGEPVLDEQTGEVVTVNDLTVGKYGVSVEAGPSYNTQRQESAQQLIDLAASSPVFEQVAIDLIAKNLNILEGDELTKRIRAMMIKQGVIQPTEEEIKELGLDQQQPDPSEQALQDNVASQTALNIASVSNKDADTLAKKVKAQQETAKTLEIVINTIINKLNAGIPITPAEQDIIVKQYDIVGESQQALDEGPNSEQRSELAQGLREPEVSAPEEIPPSL